MGRLDELHIIPRTRREDARGWLLKLMAGDEPNLEPGIGEVYATLSLPGEARGSHYHPRTREWFTVVQGQARLELEDPTTGERRVLELSAERPCTVEVPPGLAHAITAVGAGPMLMVAAASLPYDPDDVIAYRMEGAELSAAVGPLPAATPSPAVAPPGSTSRAMLSAAVGPLPAATPSPAVAPSGSTPRAVLSAAVDPGERHG